MKLPKVKFLRTAHKGPMGQDLRNVWTCGVKGDGGWYHEHATRESATHCPKRKAASKSNPAVAVRSVKVKNFTGTISNVKGRTVVKGRSKGR